MADERENEDRRQGWNRDRKEKGGQR